MVEYSADPCVNSIMHAAYDNNSRGQKGREERDRECDELLKKYFNYCELKDRLWNATMFAFSDTTTSMVSAIACYRFGHFDASMVMIRNSIDASTYTALCYNFQFNEETGEVNSLAPIESIVKYKDYKRWDDRKTEIEDQGLLTSEQIDELHKIREEGNFSAHLYEIRRDRFHEALKQVLTGQMEPGNFPKQYTSEAENKNHLNLTIDILMELHMNYVTKQGVK